MFTESMIILKKLWTFFEGMFEKERLLDIIKNFICFSNEGLKKLDRRFCRPYFPARPCLPFGEPPKLEEHRAHRPPGNSSLL